MKLPHPWASYTPCTGPLDCQVFRATAGDPNDEPPTCPSTACRLSRGDELRRVHVKRTVEVSCVQTAVAFASSTMSTCSCGGATPTRQGILSAVAPSPAAVKASTTTFKCVPSTMASSPKQWTPAMSHPSPVAHVPSVAVPTSTGAASQALAATSHTPTTYRSA